MTTGSGVGLRVQQQDLKGFLQSDNVEWRACSEYSSTDIGWHRDGVRNNLLVAVRPDVFRDSVSDIDWDAPLIATRSHVPQCPCTFPATSSSIQVMWFLGTQCDDLVSIWLAVQGA